jgi:hypothetical protein
MITRGTPPLHHLVLDLKGTSRGIDPERWGWLIKDRCLHVQAALYLAILGPLYDWAWIAHESEVPYAVRWYDPDPLDLRTGAALVTEGLRRWRAYYEHGDPWEGWPAERTVVPRPGSGPMDVES